MDNRIKTIDPKHIVDGIIYDFEKERIPISIAKDILKLIEKELDNYIMKQP